VGLEVGVLFEAAHPLRPYDFARSESPSVSGLIADLVFSVRRVWSLDRERLELYVSTGVGVSGRPAISADLPLEDQNGATQPGNFNDAPGWGVLVQAGVGSTFWLSRDFAAFVELLGVARQTHAVINEATRGDFLLQINDTQALLVFGFGTAVGGS
jgi:hypothetical protein